MQKRFYEHTTLVLAILDLQAPFLPKLPTVLGVLEKRLTFKSLKLSAL